MPFVAEQQGEVVTPELASVDSDYSCPSCDGVLRVRRSHRRGEDTFVARHFWHPGNGADCAGESDEHVRMKSVAMSKARECWPEASVRWEGTVGDRRADVLVSFDELEERLGMGVAIECQYRNESKDVEATEGDFIEAGFSVLWLDEDHFNGMDVDLDAGRWVLWWPRQVPDREVWSGFEGVVRWLRQVNYASVEMEIPEFPEALRTELRRWWVRGCRRAELDPRFRGPNPAIDRARELRQRIEATRRKRRARRTGSSEEQLRLNQDPQVQQRREKWRQKTGDIDQDPHRETDSP